MAAGIILSAPRRTYFLPPIEKPQRWILVNGVRYPAWADGVHDDSLHIQNAIDRASIFGGTVELLMGVFACENTIILPPPSSPGVVISSGTFKATGSLEAFFRSSYP